MTRSAFLLASIAALTGCATIARSPDPRGPAPSPVPPLAVGDSTAPSDSALPAIATAGDSAPHARVADDAPARPELRTRLAHRAATLLGMRGPFQVAGERFNGDCSGFVAAVYAAEGVDLRGAMQRAAPHERRGARAAWLAARADGRVFGADASPGPGDLVFWHDTYDQNRNGKADDRFTHVGIVERVAGQTVHFVHRGARGVARGVMTLARRHEAADAEGQRVNSNLRTPAHPVKRGGLAAELFAGYARFGDASPDGGAVGSVASKSHRAPLPSAGPKGPHARRKPAPLERPPQRK